MCSNIKLKIDFYNVSYPLSTNDAILEHVNLHLSAGIYQLVGVNGVGKSTILKTLNGDLHVDKFNVLLNSKPVDIYNTTSIFLFDDKFIGYEFLRPHEYINLIAMTFNLKINLDIMNYLFLKTGLIDYDHTLIKNLSQGNQQKLVILLSFVFDLNIILFDENFENLDTKTKTVFFNLMKKQLNSKIFIVVSHNNVFDELDPNPIEVNKMETVSYD